MAETSIEWTDKTWNPVTGCSRVSPGCDNCYMFTLWPRLNAMGVRGYESTPDTVTLQPSRLDQPKSMWSPKRIFVNSMSDLFHQHIPGEYITQVFETMIAAPQHTFQVLTKRPGLAVGWWERHGRDLTGDAWPPNVWIGASVETQKYAPRLTVLSRLPAPVRFVSAEPLLGRVDLMEWLTRGVLQWLIVGGESGPRARPMAPEWARDLRNQAKATGTPFFFKQWGGRARKRGHEEAMLDGRYYREYPNE